MVALGILGVKYAFWIHNMTGPQEWLEQFTGAGTTAGLYKIFFSVLILVGILWATGFARDLMQFIFSPFISLFGGRN